MIVIKHRINTINRIKNLPTNFGAEVDIRSRNKRLIISHDPMRSGIYLEKWLEFYKHRFIIFNIKEEGLEKELFKVIKKFSVGDFFLLDQSFPYYIKHLNIYGKYSSLRISDFESLDKKDELSKITKWLWIDFLRSFPLTASKIVELKKRNHKLCVVSPELINNFKVEEKIRLIRKRFEEAKIKIDAVCTKKSSLWVT